VTRGRGRGGGRSWIQKEGLTKVGRRKVVGLTTKEKNMTTWEEGGILKPGIEKGNVQGVARVREMN